MFRKSSSKGPQRLEKYPDEKSVCLRGCPKVRGAWALAPPVCSSDDLLSPEVREHPPGGGTTGGGGM